MVAMVDEQGGVARRSFIFVVSNLCVFPLLGCTLPGGGKPARRIRLTAAESFPPRLRSVAWTLQVQEPTATLSLNTAKIAIGTPDDIQSLADGEWASRAPEMVMELLVESFKASNKILTVGDRRARIRPDFVLQLRLAQFQVERNTQDSGTVRVALEATLLKRPSRDPLSTISFDAATDVSPLSLDSIVAAFDESLRDVMEQVVEWSLETGANA